MLKNYWLLILIILIVAILLFWFYQHIAFQTGRKTSSVWLEKVQASPQFRKGIFVNQVPTNMERPPWEGIREMMKKQSGQRPEKVLSTFPIDVKLIEQAAGDETLITWLGHSSLLIKTGGITLLTDPVFNRRASLFQQFGPLKFDYTHEYSVDQLPPVDVVLLTHDHYDHLEASTIVALNHRVKLFVCPPGVGARLEHWGVAPQKITELDWWEQMNYRGIVLTATPGRHFSGRFLNDRMASLWCGWAIKSEQANLYLSGDSGYNDGFKEVGKKLGPFDFGMMECGQYSQYWPTIHLFPEESVQAAIDAGCKAAMPIHWGKFKLSIHAWNEPPARFKQKAGELGLPLALPRIGETFNLNMLPADPWW
jgi:L-ascorbate metabolism protein UlaG (beta-lactamase superfamily)